MKILSVSKKVTNIDINLFGETEYDFSLILKVVRLIRISLRLEFVSTSMF